MNQTVEEYAEELTQSYMAQFELTDPFEYLDVSEYAYLSFAVELHNRYPSLAFPTHDTISNRYAVVGAEKVVALLEKIDSLKQDVSQRTPATSLMKRVFRR
jgi:hypothetical protein